MGIKIEKFKNDLIFLINNCELDLGIVYYVLKDVFNIVEKEYIKLLTKEEQDQQNKENKTE